MPAEAYTSVPLTGKLKLKGVTDSRIDKKKKKKKPKPDGEAVSGTVEEPSTDTFTDNSVVLKSLADEDAQIVRPQQPSKKDRTDPEQDQPENEDPNTPDISEMNRHLKTASERRFEEQRRKRLEERLKREGVKTHKQRVEELNRYLSGLSEHHDMPKIGPG